MPITNSDTDLPSLSAAARIKWNWLGFTLKATTRVSLHPLLFPTLFPLTGRILLDHFRENLYYNRVNQV